MLGSFVEVGKRNYREFQDSYKSMQENLEVQERKNDDHYVQIYNEATKRLTEIYSEQEILWRQRCKQLLLREGDSNSKYFHNAIKVRRKVNTISSLYNNEGQTVDWNTGLKELIEYFTGLFTATNIEWEAVVQCVNGRITEEHNLILNAQVEDS